MEIEVFNKNDLVPADRLKIKHLSQIFTQSFPFDATAQHSDAVLICNLAEIQSGHGNCSEHLWKKRSSCCCCTMLLLIWIKASTLSRDFYIYYIRQRRNEKYGILLLFLISFVGLGTWLLFTSPHLILLAKKQGALFLVERDAIAFEIQTALISKAPECFPIEISKNGHIGIQYLFCSKEAKSRDSQEAVITENFSVPPGLARRYNFWRRIYSTFSKDQYVLHSAEWPEVVLAIYDLSNMPESLSSDSRERLLRKLTSHHKKIYIHLLTQMHRNRDRPDKYSYAMNRIARAMSHITDDMKYLKAAQRIRIQRGQRDFIEKGLHVAPKYLDAIELEFQAQGVPIELAKLAFVESSFNTSAYSKVGASGVFQIMPMTGKQYLKIGEDYDERNDPIKAGRAAAQILKFYYNLTNSWPLAITAYNHGVGGIKKATAATGSQELHVLVQKYQGSGFGFASKNFYSSFLGMIATLKDKDKLFPGLPQVAPLQFKTYRLAKSIYSSTVRNRFNCSKDEFRELNLDLSKEIHRDLRKIPAGYLIKVPYKNVSYTLNNNDES
jgi:membrane-bound lytic murein transglycosylase D